MMDLGKFKSEGKFLMLALDHRGSFKKLINPQSPDSVPNEVIVDLKSEIISALQDQFSGLLIDETYGLDAYPKHSKPFLLPVEKSGYSSDQIGEKVTELEYSIEQVIKMGASGAKLLIYFNSNLESAKKQLETARKVLEECRANSFPLFLEIVTYGNEQREGLVIESVRAFKELGIIPDVWKLQYPGDLDACREMTNLTEDIPWILLTGGGSFDNFKNNLNIATKAGAKGFLAGRALWQEACSLQGEEKKEFLEKTLPERFKILSEIAKS